MHFFTNVQSHLCWSSTTYDYNISGAWIVHMGDGGVFNLNNSL